MIDRLFFIGGGGAEDREDVFASCIPELSTRQADELRHLMSAVWPIALCPPPPPPPAPLKQNVDPRFM